MCTLQGLKDSNKEEHNEIKIEVASMKSSIKMLFIALSITMTLTMVFSGLGTNYQRLTYIEKAASNDMLDKLQDSITIHWKITKSTLMPLMGRYKITYDSILKPTELRSKANKIAIIKANASIKHQEDLMIKHGLK